VGNQIKCEGAVAIPRLSAPLSLKIDRRASKGNDHFRRSAL